MIDFLSGCSRLFTMVFSAAMTLEIFRFLTGAMILGCGYGTLLLLYKGTKRGR